MPGATTELSLSTAVDSDDNADYLTLSLANSLRTVDALFNNLTGHNHGGAHQGAAVAPAAIPGGSITNAQLGPDVARANLLTNGGFEQWQRGNGPFTGVNVYSADRWTVNLNGTSTLSVSKDTVNVDTPGSAAALTYVHNTISYWYQGLKPSDQAGLRGRTITLAIRVRTTTGAAIKALLWFDGTGGATSVGTAHTGGGAYETLTITAAIPADSTFVNVGVQLLASCTAYVDNAMLVVGSQAANYAPLHPTDEMARCLRYYETMGGSVADEMLGLLWCYAATGGAFPVRWKVRKAVSPTVTVNGAWRVQFGAGGFTASTLGFGAGSVDSVNAAISGATGLTVGQVAAVSSQNVGTSFLTIEGNP